MRVNIYAEEMPQDLKSAVEIIEKDGFTGLRIYLHMPVTWGGPTKPQDYQGTDEEFKDQYSQLKGPFIHKPGDDDSSAVTFWGKKDLRDVLIHALKKLDDHYIAKHEAFGRAENLGD